jgi:hypothetical protein
MEGREVRRSEVEPSVRLRLGLLEAQFLEVLNRKAVQEFRLSLN